MNDKTITFLSSRGRGLNADLSLIHDVLASNKKWKEYSYRFFVKSERTQNPVVNAGIQKAKKAFNKDSVHTICIDSSLTGKLKEDSGLRILYSVPYDYQFKNYLAAKKKKTSYRTFQAFTHIVPGSPFTEELLNLAYDTEEKIIESGVAHPLAWDVTKEASCEEARKKLELYFPNIREKKILSLIINGEEEEQEKFFSDFSFENFMKKLGQDWIVLTTSKKMRDCSFSYTGNKGTFGYIDHIVPPSVLVYVADVLITNEGRFATAYAGKHKPMYCPKVKNNFFEKFMETEYSNLVIKKANQMLDIDFEQEKLTKEQDKYCSQFWYEEAKEPYFVLDAIKEMDEKEGGLL